MAESVSSAMMVEHPAPHRERVHLAILIFGVFVGPIVWALHLFLNSAVAGEVCYPGPMPRLTHFPSLRLMLGASGAVAMIIALIGAYISYRSWRTTREEREGSHHHLIEVGEGRTPFLAFAGMFISLLFAVVIFCDTAGVLLVSACGK
jgi:hypothetical protein